MRLRHACASALVLVSVLAGAPAASAADLSGPAQELGGAVATGVNADGKAWACRYLGLFC